MTKIKYRIDNEMYNKIFTNPDSIEDLDKVSFDLMIDLFTNLCLMQENKQRKIDYEINVNSFNLKEIIITTLLRYLINIMNTYCCLISGSHRIGAMIILRTITEIDIKIRYLFLCDDQYILENYIKNSLVTEKIYLNELKGMKSFNSDYIKSTTNSINKLMKFSNVDNIDEISKKKNKIPKIEDMSKYLASKGIISEEKYNILYRNTSNYLHANWSAVSMETLINNKECVDIRLIAPLSITIIDLYLFLAKHQYFKEDEFDEKLKYYQKAFWILDENFEKRFLKNS